MSTLGTMGNKFFGPFLWVVTGCGSLAFLYSALQVDFGQFDSRFAVLVGDGSAPHVAHHDPDSPFQFADFSF